MRMYQLPMLIRTRMSRVPRATKSPCSQRAPKPYGLSTVSFWMIGPVAIGAGAGAEAVSAEGAAGADAAPASGADAGWARTASGDKAKAQKASAASAVARRA